MKKLFAVLMALLIVFSICVPSFAVEIDNTNTSGNAIATYEANSSFKVTIPTYIAPSEKGETASANMYSVTASDVFIPDGNQLTVTVDYDGILTDRNGVEIPYKLFSGGSEVTNGQKIITKDAGNPDDTATVNFSAAVQAKPRYAGTYIDNVTFNISVEERVYSLEEINADEHLYAIGKTKPEYVVAKFNDDYSEVTVVKNGSESDGEMMNWNYRDKSPFTENAETLKISAVKDDVVNIGYCAFSKCTTLASVTIPDSVTSIESGAFYNCTTLESITIPDSVTSIGDNAFYGCSSLKSITIPSGIKSIRLSTFGKCTSLTSITIPDSVTSIESATFEGCTSLVSVTIPDSVTSIGGNAFARCSSLKNITIPNSVTSIGNYAFNGCTSLTSITIPSSIMSIESSVFKGCTSLENITIPDSVTSIGYGAFDSCTSLEKITVPDNVTSIGNYAFNECTSLTSITIPDSVTSIGNRAFYGCISLENVTIGNSVTSIGGSAFSNTAYYNTESNWENGVLYIGKYLITAKYTISGEYKIKDGTICVADSAFGSCTSLKNIIIPGSVTSIGSGAFSHCTSLENITIPSSITSIRSDAFNNSGLKTIYGVSGSYAETFAGENGYTFIAQS